MTDRLAELERAATPGPWTTDLDIFDPDPPYCFDVCVVGPDVSMLFVSETDVLNDTTLVSSQLARETQAWADAAFIAAARNALPGLLRVVAAAEAYSPERDHDWRCEIRTAEVGWKHGDRPVIRCECGFDELEAALAALPAAKDDPA